MVQHKQKRIKIDRILVVLASLREVVLEELSDAYRRMNIADINPPHGAVLCALPTTGSCEMNEIAEHVFRDQSTITTLVNHLEKLEYVKVARSSEDKRKRLVRLTSRGQKLRHRVTRATRNIQRQIFSEIPGADRRKLMEVLVKIGYNLHSPHFSQR